jgi:hypothetical protein
MNYEIINGSKLESKPKGKPVKSLAYIDDLQKRAERMWNNGLDEDDKHRVTVLINYVNLNNHNRKSENIGKEGFYLEKWM